MAETNDLTAYRRAREQRAAEATIELFAEILGKPLALRELTPEQQARRDARLAERRRQRPPAV